MEIKQLETKETPGRWYSTIRGNVVKRCGDHIPFPLKQKGYSIDSTFTGPRRPAGRMSIVGVNALGASV